MEHFSKVEVIGSGSFGKVYKAVDNKTLQPVAIKLQQASADSLRELATFKALGVHPNIIKWY
jgi:serine/threonine protein kinase